MELSREEMLGGMAVRVVGEDGEIGQDYVNQEDYETLKNDIHRILQRKLDEK